MTWRNAADRSAGRAALRWTPYLLPGLGLTALFVAYPAADAVRLSLFRWSGYGPKRFVGLDNFGELASDLDFRWAILHSMLFGVLTTAFSVGIGTTIALALDRKLPGHRFFRFVVFLPVILPNAFIAAAWAAGLDPYYGWVNQALAVVSDGLARPWLGDGSLVLYVIALVSVLQTTGFPMIVVHGALGNIPQEIQDAATIDGMTGAQRALSISLPLVRNVIATVALLQFTWGFAAFDYIFVMTNGGPGTASEVGGTFVYHQAFVQNAFGYASAAAMAMSGLLALGMAVYYGWYRGRSASGGVR